MGIYKDSDKDKLKTKLPELIPNESVQVYGTNIVSISPAPANIMPLSPHEVIPKTNLVDVPEIPTSTINEVETEINKADPGFQLPSIDLPDPSATINGAVGSAVVSIPTIDPTKLSPVIPVESILLGGLPVADAAKTAVGSYASQIVAMQEARILGQTMPLLAGLAALAVSLKTLSNVVDKIPGGSGISLPGLDIFSSTMLSKYSKYVDGADLSGITDTTKWYTNQINNSIVAEDARIPDIITLTGKIPLNSIVMESVYEKYVNGQLTTQELGPIEIIPQTTLQALYPNAVITSDGFRYKLPPGRKPPGSYTLGSTETEYYYINIAFPLGISYFQIASGYSGPNKHIVEGHLDGIYSPQVVTGAKTNNILTTATQTTHDVGVANYIEILSSVGLQLNVIKSLIEGLELPSEIIKSVYTGRSLASMELLNKITNVRIFPPIQNLTTIPVDYFYAKYGYFDTALSQQKQKWQFTFTQNFPVTQDEMDADISTLNKNADIEAPTINSFWQDPTTGEYFIVYDMSYKFDDSFATEAELTELLSTILLAAPDNPRVFVELKSIS